MDGLKFIGDLVGDQNLSEFDIFSILDSELFFLSVDEEDIEEIYFWSMITFNIFMFDLKKLGTITINGNKYDKKSFPFEDIHDTHKLFESKLSKERLNVVKNNIESFEKQLIKLTIDKMHSN